MRLSRPCLAVALAAALAVMLPSTPGRAQQTPNAPLAEQLYLEGQQLMRAGDPASIQQACDKFAASQRLDPAVGTLLNLAVCHEKQGKTATAWSEFTEAAAQAAGGNQPPERERYARERVAALAQRLQKLVIEMPLQAPGTQVKLDGQQLPPDAVGTEIPLDPGTHALDVTAPGKKSWSQSVTLDPGTPLTHVRVELQDAEGRPPEVVPGGNVVTPAIRFEGPAVPAAGEHGGGSTGKTLGFVALGVGAVAVGTGIAFAFHAASLKSSSDNEANEAVAAQKAGDASSHTSDANQSKADYSSAQGSQTAAIVSGVVALVGAATGVVLLTMSSSPSRPATGLHLRPQVGLRMTGLTLDASW